MMDNIQVDQAPVTENWGLKRVDNWKLVTCFIPRKCFLTSKNLWLNTAYYGSRMITGPGEPVYDHYYIDKDEFLLWQLKRQKY